MAKNSWRPASRDQLRHEVETPGIDGDQTEHTKRVVPLDEADYPQSEIAAANAEIRDVPAFLRQTAASGDQAPGPQSSGLSSVRLFIARTRAHWRRHFVPDVPNTKTERIVGRLGNGAFALLSSVTVVTCLGAAIALGQIRLLKSEIAQLQRELLPLSGRLARLEQVEKTRRDNDQAAEKQNNAGVENNRPSAHQTALKLSPEEIQLIKDYIKPAPYSGPPGPAINVGDPVTATMIPLPSPLTDKMPKLLGATFTIRNGTIIIVKSDSHKAAIVLAPH